MKIDYKQLFIRQMIDVDVLLPDQTEYQFMHSRGFLLDYAWTDLKIGVEYQGGTFMKRSGHNNPRGSVRDYHKSNELAIRGWLLIVINFQMVEDGTAVWYVQRAVRERQRQLAKAALEETR